MLALNSELKRASKEVLKSRWGISAIVTLLFMLISGALAYVVVINLLLLPVITFGYMVLFLGVYRGEEVEMGKLFVGFNNYKKTLLPMLLVAVYTFLWSLLLVIPGIVKSYSYAMTPYIVNDNPEIGANQAIEESMRMMAGHKMKLFLLDLSFIGWILLSLLTFGIGMLWLSPYMYAARAAFYEDLKKENL